MVDVCTVVEQAPGILVYRAGKWYPIPMCIRKAIRPWFRLRPFFVVL